MTELPQTPEAVAALMQNLKFTDESPADVPPRPSPEFPVTVVRSLRLPFELDQRLRAAATARNVPASTLVREWIEAALAALENDQPISRADALRALAGLRPLTG